MPYDYQLVGGALIAVIGLLHGASLMVDQRSPLGGIVLFLVGIGLVGWAWQISGEDLVIFDLPNAVFRILGTLLN